MSTTNELTGFNKTGVAVTNAQGIAYVIFTHPMDYGVSYSVALNCSYPGQATIAYSTNISQTGFTIFTRDTKQPNDVAVPNVTVYWMARVNWNE